MTKTTQTMKGEMMKIETANDLIDAYAALTEENRDKPPVAVTGQICGSFVNAFLGDENRQRLQPWRAGPES